MPRHSECGFHFLLLGMSDSGTCCVTTPPCNGGVDLVQYLLRLGITDSEKWRDLHRKLKVEGVVRIGYVQREAMSLRIRIDVVGRRKLPARFCQQKPVVAQMVVRVGYRDGENEASPEFVQIGVRSCAVAHDEFRKLKIAFTLLGVGSVRFAKQRHCRGKMNPFGTVSVKTFGQKGRTVLGKVF